MGPEPEILLLSQLYPPAVGGSAVLFKNVYERVTRYRVAVLTDRDLSPGPDGIDGGVHVYHRPFATRRWGVLGPGPLRDHWQTIRQLRSIPVASRALVHCARALPEGVSTLLGYPLLRRKYLCWAHGEELTTARASREFAFLLRRALARSAGVIANSRNTKRLLQDIGVPSARIGIAYPGVDTGRFSPYVDGSRVRQRVAPNSEVVLLTIGRLQRRKGHDHVLATLPSVRRTGVQARYLIVGDGEERQRLEALAREYGVADSCVFVGQVPESDLPAYYAAADIFIHPNREVDLDVEGFGIVFLEAQSSGRPVIGGRSGGVPEAIAEGETGYLVSGEDVHETAETLRRLIADAALRSRLGEAGRRYVSANFTWDRAARAVEAIHAQVLECGSLEAAQPAGPRHA